MEDRLRDNLYNIERWMDKFPHQSRGHGPVAIAFKHIRWLIAQIRELQDLVDRLEKQVAELERR